MKAIGKAFLFLLFAFAALSILAAIGQIMNDRKPQPSVVASNAPTIMPPRVEDQVSIASINWRLGGFGTVAIGTFQIKNGNAFSIRDTQLTCDFFGKSGTLLTSQSATIYDVVPASGSKTFKEVNIGLVHSQSAKASCRVSKASRVQISILVLTDYNQTGNNGSHSEVSRCHSIP